jgi:hypothetical protein
VLFGSVFLLVCVACVCVGGRGGTSVAVAFPRFRACFLARRLSRGPLAAVMVFDGCGAVAVCVWGYSFTLRLYSFAVRAVIVVGT